MARTTSAAVQAILLRDYDTTNLPDLSPFIEWAGAVVDDMYELAVERNYTFTDERLELIERWLAAHAYAQTDLPAQDRTTGKSSMKGQGKTGYGFNSTYYGQRALLLDKSGRLAILNTSSTGADAEPAVAGAFWPGVTEDDA